MDDKQTLGLNHNDVLRYERISQELDTFVLTQVQKRERAFKKIADDELAREVGLRDKYWKKSNQLEDILVEVLATANADRVLPDSLVAKLRAWGSEPPAA